MKDAEVQAVLFATDKSLKEVCDVTVDVVTPAAILVNASPPAE